MNPLFQQLVGGMAQNQQVPAPNMMNPLQRINFIRQAMTNPAAFIKQRFPDIQDQMMNDPNQILNYLQSTRGISNQQIQQLKNQFGGMT